MLDTWQPIIDRKKLKIIITSNRTQADSLIEKWYTWRFRLREYCICWFIVVLIDFLPVLSVVWNYIFESICSWQCTELGQVIMSCHLIIVTSVIDNVSFTLKLRVVSTVLPWINGVAEEGANSGFKKATGPSNKD